MASAIINLSRPLVTAVEALIILVVSMFLFFVLYVWNQHRRYCHIPGPKRKNFFCGNIAEIEDKGKLVYEIFLDHAVVYGPVFVWWYYFTPVVVVSSPELIKYGLITLNLPKAPPTYSQISHLFGRYRFLGSGLFTQLNHDHWKQKRRLISPAFHRSYLKDLVPQFNSVAYALVAKLSKVADGKTVIDMADEFHKATLDVIGKVAFSMDLRCLDDPKSQVHNCLLTCLEAYEESYKQPLLCLPYYKQSYQKTVYNAVFILRKIARECIEKRQKAMKNGEPLPNDVLGMILAADIQAEQTTNMEELIDEFLTFFIAGQDTTANQLSFALLETLLNEEIENRLCCEVESLLGTKETVEHEDIAKLDYLGQILKESLRKHPPAAGTMRMTTKSETFGAFQIPKATKVNFSILVSHHSPEYWHNPEKFIPERFSASDQNRISNFVYFPFSCGPRNCIGNIFSSLNAAILMARLFQKFKFHLVPGQTVQRGEKLTIRPKHGVLCTIQERCALN